MSNDNKKIIKIASVYTGTVLGAGFASGQELLSFFVSFGPVGMAGLMLAGVLFAVIGFAVLSTMDEYKTKSYDELICLMLGKRLGVFTGLLVVLFLLILFCTMLAAGGSCLREMFGMPAWLGSVVVAGICFVTFVFDVDGIVKINTILCPLLVIGGAVVGAYLTVYEAFPVFAPFEAIKAVGNNWFVSAFVYVSYNVLTAISVLASLHGILNSKKTALKSAALSGFLMCLLGVLLSLPMLLRYAQIEQAELPVLVLIRQSSHDGIAYLYLLVLLAAIFTTAAANGFAVTQWICSKARIKPLYGKLFVTGFAVLVSQIGFSNFVGILYPLFGYIGLFEVVVILLLVFRRVKLD